MVEKVDSPVKRVGVKSNQGMHPVKRIESKQPNHTPKYAATGVTVRHKELS